MILGVFLGTILGIFWVIFDAIRDKKSGDFTPSIIAFLVGIFWGFSDRK